VRVVTVTEVRRHLYWASGGPRTAGVGAPSTALLGRLFHDVYGVLTGPDAERNLVAPLGLADASAASWRQALVDHAYKTIVCPVLAANEVVLQASAQPVLDFWVATQALCAWLSVVMFDRLAATDRSVSLAALREEIFAGTEVELEAELTDPSWPEPVLLQGRADGLLLRHADARHCVLELKLGRAHPEADLLQGCLYQLLLASRDADQAQAALAMMTFEPLPRQHLFEATRLREAQAALKAVVADVAGFDTALTPPRPGGSLGTGALLDPIPAGELDAIRRKLAAAFAEYGAPLDIAADAACGPAFVRFYASPQRGVSVNSIGRISQNVWMRLGTSRPPRVALENGRIAIDVERASRVPVRFEAWESRLPPRSPGGSAHAAIGVTVDGELLTADLSESQSPHMLVVGTTGSGKSEWLRSLLASLMAGNAPDTLRLALIDPKRLAFSAFQDSPYLWQPVVFDEGVVELLSALVEEMERRYVLLQQASVDDLTSFNRQATAHAGGAKPRPRLVCVCDEFADLLLRDKATRKAVEERVARLGVKGRAAGVHLVFATQRAGREIIRGTIDSNLPARVALAVPRGIDSRLILGEAGAETLLGRGDLLYKDIGAPVRAQSLIVARETLSRLMQATR
jgi:S-DNA-T family DNA segregation ATPase FtsK/SpoIIIE